MRSAVGVAPSYVFGQRRGNSCPPPGESSGGGGGGAASRQVVVVRPPPPAISSVLPTTFQHGLPSCPAAVAVAKSYGYRTFFRKICRHVAQSRRLVAPADKARVADHCCRSVFAKTFGSCSNNKQQKKKKSAAG
ncbi:unnamed protein product [Macrosiphum euphorbiae]|uniref:Uncharacterized protein n=1 Tax=Macrosiphum euphorbiae TaxID=13131 RepID=A0AAV0X5K0_9HEMI|nr:unnamed protein product [Macrosiphum euphorbiae]